MRALLVALMLGILAAVPAGPDAAASEHDRARGAVQSGEVRPLGDILAGVRGRYPGRVLDANLRQQGRGQWRYDIKILQSDGRVVNLTVDARTGRVLRAKGQGSSRGRGNRGRSNNGNRN